LKKTCRVLQNYGFGMFWCFRNMSLLSFSFSWLARIGFKSGCSCLRLIWLEITERQDMFQCRELFCCKRVCVAFCMQNLGDGDVCSGTFTLVVTIRWDHRWSKGPKQSQGQPGQRHAMTKVRSGVKWWQ
jgi:hypothetical protein